MPGMENEGGAARIRRSDLKVARVLFEDDDFVTLEIAKDEHRTLRIEDGDRFFTLVFLKQNPEDGTATVWTPWEG